MKKGLKILAVIFCFSVMSFKVVSKISHSYDRLNYDSLTNNIDGIFFKSYKHKINDSLSFITAKFSKTAVNPDGSTRAYHPRNSGILYNKNGGIIFDSATKTADISKSFAIHYVLATDKKTRIPTIQGNSSPNPGYYVSTTSWNNLKYSESDVKRYLNSEVINFVAYTNKMAAIGIEKGIIGRAKNIDNGEIAYFVVADSRGNRTSEEIEMSMSMANKLKVKLTWKDVKNYDEEIVRKLVGIKEANIEVRFFSKIKLSQKVGIDNQSIIDFQAEQIDNKIIKEL